MSMTISLKSTENVTASPKRLLKDFPSGQFNVSGISI
jgi:hypothetical protein